MKELHALVDYENVQPTLEELEKLAPGFTDVWLFHGPHQAAQAREFAEAHEHVTPVPRSGAGPNALDFHLSFYLGYVAARHPDAHMVVVANDKGYDPMIAHANTLGFTVRRQGHKDRPAAKRTVRLAVKKVAQPAARKVAPPAAKKPAPIAKAVPVKKAAPAKAPVATKKVAAKKAPAKKAPAKKTVATKAPAPKVEPQRKATKKAAVTVSPSPESKGFTRVRKALARMGAERPAKLMSFLRAVKAMLGKDSTAEEVDAVVHKLEQAKLVRVTGDKVAYG